MRRRALCSELSLGSKFGLRTDNTVLVPEIALWRSVKRLEMKLFSYIFDMILKQSRKKLGGKRYQKILKYSKLRKEKL